MENIKAESGSEASTQHTVIYPVKKGTIFMGQIRLENLSDLELGALLSALQLHSGKRHQLGMGKPLGMGSVKINATLNLTKRTGEHNRYASLFGKDGKFHLGTRSDECNEKIEEKAKQAFQKGIVQHHNNCKAHPLPADADLWSIPRLEELAQMLEWDNPPDCTRTAYMPLHNGKAWRERKVLPTPS